MGLDVRRLIVGRLFGIVRLAAHVTEARHIHVERTEIDHERQLRKLRPREQRS